MRVRCKVCGAKFNTDKIVDICPRCRRSVSMLFDEKLDKFIKNKRR